MSARARMNEMAKAFARRVVDALVSEPDHFAGPAAGAVADKIMDDLHDVQVIVTGEVRDMKRVRLVLDVSGAVAQSILRAAAIPDPPMAEATSFEDLAAGVRTYMPAGDEAAPACPHGVRHVFDCMYCTPLVTRPAPFFALTPEGPVAPDHGTYVVGTGDE